MIPHHPVLPALARYRGYGYGYGPREVVCSVLTGELMPDIGVPVVRGGSAWKALQMSEPGAGPWDPVTTINAIAGDGASYPTRDGIACPNPGRLILCQGWRRLHDGRIVPKGQGRPPSNGHQWLWLADDTAPWMGVCIESSGDGPRVWDATGKHLVADVVDADGRLIRELVPMPWTDRAGRWTPDGQVQGEQCGVAWCVLP